MLDHNEKLKLVIEFIQSGIKDADAIIFNINKIEKELFKEKN
ncbi:MULTISPECIES: hypothetical protein [unclassified Acinetobacter]|nr:MULTISPECIES: hypothetical protein [unclassified Acinetobacter]